MASTMPARWRANGTVANATPLFVSVNLSAREFSQAGLVEDVGDVMYHEDQFAGTRGEGRQLVVADAAFAVAGADQDREDVVARVVGLEQRLPVAVAPGEVPPGTYQVDLRFTGGT